MSQPGFAWKPVSVDDIAEPVNESVLIRRVVLKNYMSIASTDFQ
jgi:hypothetical protein